MGAWWEEIGRGEDLGYPPLVQVPVSIPHCLWCRSFHCLGPLFPLSVKKKKRSVLVCPDASSSGSECPGVQGTGPCCPRASQGWVPVMTVSRGWRLCNTQTYQEGTTVCSAAEQSIIRLSQHQQKYRINVIREEMEKNAASVKASSGSPWFPEH